ncbi:MarR family winged helix-turn-helix transcriptional regulator [Elongatibacter sediminis]|uniref:MarR family transcriptional regulator n=1 Tax=Elongatibacter sediminis TaxID=3119006 RepID=A0AAW9RES8_9GAMM
MSRAPENPEIDGSESPHEESVLRSIRRITRAIDLYSRKLVSSCDLTGPQLACLRELARLGELPTTRLAAAVSLSPATVTGILDRLEQAGLLERQRPESDKRCVMVTLSAAGRDALRHAPPLLQDGFTQRFRALSAASQSQLDRALQEIVAMMEAEELDASPLLIPAEEPARSASGSS